MAIMRSGKNKICEKILWGVGMGLGLENVQVWVQAEGHVGMTQFMWHDRFHMVQLIGVMVTHNWARVGQ